MNAVLALLREKSRTPIGLGILGLIVLSCGAFAFLSRDEAPDDQSPEQRLFVKAKRAISGQKLKLDNDQEEYLILAGIRAPVGGEQFYDEATRRNNELVEDKKIRLRFDEERRDSEGRLLAYVFVDDTFANEVLVREGLAYARLTTTSDRFGQRLLAAQAEAQKAKRGVWSKRPSGNEKSYACDPKYGNFHRTSCEEAAKIPSERLVAFQSDKDAMHKGFAPCAKCKP
jgi:micrococcal nuclease